MIHSIAIGVLHFLDFCRTVPFNLVVLSLHKIQSRHPPRQPQLRHPWLARQLLLMRSLQNSARFWQKLTRVKELMPTSFPQRILTWWALAWHYIPTHAQTKLEYICILCGNAACYKHLLYSKNGNALWDTKSVCSAYLAVHWALGRILNKIRSKLQVAYLVSQHVKSSKMQRQKQSWVPARCVTLTLL